MTITEIHEDMNETLSNLSLEASHCPNDGSPGHCLICEDPYDYCPGHRQRETEQFLRLQQ